MDAPDAPTPNKIIFAAVDRILDRRRRAGDDDLYRAADTGLELVDYVLQHRRVAPEVLREDLLDTLRILTKSRRRIENQLRSVLRAARDPHARLGVGGRSRISLLDLAEPLEVNSPQAAHGLITRLEFAAQPGGNRDQKQAQKVAKQRRVDGDLRSSGEGIVAVAGWLLAERTEVDGYYDLSDLEEELAAHEPGQPVSIELHLEARMAVRELRRTLPVAHRLRPVVEMGMVLLESDG